MAAALIAYWIAGNGSRYRLIHKGTSWIVEIEAHDVLGDKRWNYYTDFGLDDKNGILAQGIASEVLKDERYAAAHKLGGWDAVSDLVRSKLKLE